MSDFIAPSCSWSFDFSESSERLFVLLLIIISVGLVGYFNSAFAWHTTDVSKPQESSMSDDI